MTSCSYTLDNKTLHQKEECKKKVRVDLVYLYLYIERRTLVVDTRIWIVELRFQNRLAVCK